MGNNCICLGFLNKGNHKGESAIYEGQLYSGETHMNSEFLDEDEVTTLNRKNTQRIFEGNRLSFDPNKKINIDDFDLIKVLGKGSFGKVMLVENKDTNAVAKRNQKMHTESERRILEDMNNNQFIVHLHYAFQTKAKLYMVMDFMQGGELFFHLRKSFKFSENRSKFYSAEIILAIEYLHKHGIIYRDLKPENILLDVDGNIKIADFGLSKLGLDEISKTYTFCGTPEYLAPEILLGLGHDKSVDWWSLGALLYEMISGAPPFYSRDKNKMFKNILEKPIEMKPYFSSEASSLLQGLLCLDPKKRLGASSEDALEIKQHPFYNNVSWEKLATKHYEPPFKPKVTGPKDLRHFDRMFTEEQVKDTPVNNSGDVYMNFTYVKRENSTAGKGSNFGFNVDIIENPNFNLEK